MINATSLSSDTGNPSLDDDEKRSSRIRAELKRINETLILSVMVKNQPYASLPYQYVPNWDIDHRPPEFLHGLGLTFAEIREHVIRLGLPISTDERSMSLKFEFGKYLNRLFGLDEAADIVYGFFPRIGGPVIFRLKTNYYSDLTAEKIKEIAATCERVFHRRPMWYVGSARKKDYRISESKFFLSVE